MKAVIMAGGKGKRLLPLTYCTPKPMVRLFSKPVLEYVLELLKKNGFDEVRICLGYMANAIEEYVSDKSTDGFKILCSTETVPLGTAGAVRAAAKDITEPFLVISADCICDFNLAEIMEFHLSHKAEITIACTKVEDPREYGVVEFDGSDKVKAFTEKPPWSCAVSDCVNTGIYVINPDVLRLVPEQGEFDFSKDLFPLLLKQGKSILHYEAEGYWCDIGNPKAFLGCMRDILDMKTKIRLNSVTGGIYSDYPLASGDYSVIEPCFIGKRVSIGRGAVIGPYAVIDDGCTVGGNSAVSDSCMLRDSTVLENVTVKGSVLCNNSSVKSGSELSDGAVVGPYACVESGCTVGNGTVIPPQSILERGSYAQNSIRYIQTAKCLNDDNRFSGQLGIDFDAVSAAVIGQALASMEIGAKTGVLTDGTIAAKAVASAIIGALTCYGCNVWSFGEGFYSQLEFYTRFCALKSSVFISSREAKINITLCGENGLPLSNANLRELENRIKSRDFKVCPPEDYRGVSDMSGVSMMYRREIIRQTDTELSDVSCCVKCPNEKITMLIEDCLYRLGCRAGDAITFRINAYGNLLSAFTRECGWISHDTLSAIVLGYETSNGRDISVTFNSPAVFDRIASDNGRRVLRYYQSATDMSDRTAREMSANNPFMRDALLMAVKLLNIICVTGKSLDRLVRDVPDFYVSRKRIDLPFLPTQLSSRLSASSPSATREGISISFPDGRVTLLPTRSGRRLNILSEAVNYEISKDLCAKVEKMIKDNGEKNR